MLYLESKFGVYLPYNTATGILNITRALTFVHVLV